MSSWVRDTYARRSTTFKRIFSFKRKSVTEASAAVPKMAQPHGTRPSAEGGSGDSSSDAGPSRDELSPDVSYETEPKRKRFRAFRVVRKIFRRKPKHAMSRGDTDDDHQTPSTLKSRSTSELLGSDRIDDDRHSGAMSGLSLSHDSVFTPDTMEDPKSARVRSSLQKELARKFGARQESDDDDAGLPRSPCTSPTTNEILRQGLMMGKSGTFHSSDASLLSMGSSETDNEDGRDSSGSRLLFLKTQGTDPDLDVGATVLLNNVAALHKRSVKPRRTHAIPQHRRVEQVTTVASLPTTPEDTEEVVVPVVKPKPSPRTRPSKAPTPSDRIPPSTARTELPPEVIPVATHSSEGQPNVNSSVERRRSLKLMNLNTESSNSHVDGTMTAFRSPDGVRSPVGSESDELTSCFNLNLINGKKNSFSYDDEKKKRSSAEDKTEMSARQDVQSKETINKLPTVLSRSHGLGQELDTRDIGSMPTHVSRSSLPRLAAEHAACPTDSRSTDPENVVSAPITRTGSFRRSNNIARLSQHFEKSPLENSGGGDDHTITDATSLKTYNSAPEGTQGKPELDTTKGKMGDEVAHPKTTEQTTVLHDPVDSVALRPARTEDQVSSVAIRREVPVNISTNGLTAHATRKGVIVDGVMVVGEHLTSGGTTSVGDSLMPVNLRASGTMASSTRKTAVVDVAPSGSVHMAPTRTNRVTPSMVRRNFPVREGMIMSGQDSSDKKEMTDDTLPSTRNTALAQNGDVADFRKEVGGNVPLTENSVKASRVTPPTIRRNPAVYGGSSATGQQTSNRIIMTGEKLPVRNTVGINGIAMSSSRSVTNENKEADSAKDVDRSLSNSEELPSLTKNTFSGSDMLSASKTLSVNTEIFKSETSIRNSARPKAIMLTNDPPSLNSSTELSIHNTAGDPSRGKRQSVHQQLSVEDIRELEESGRSLPVSSPQEPNSKAPIYSFRVAKDNYNNTRFVNSRPANLTPKSPDKDFATSASRLPSYEQPPLPAAPEMETTVAVAGKAVEKKSVVAGEPFSRNLTPLKIRSYSGEVSGPKVQSPSAAVRPDVPISSQLKKSDVPIIKPLERPAIQVLPEQLGKDTAKPVPVKEIKDATTSARISLKGIASSTEERDHPNGAHKLLRMDLRAGAPVNTSKNVSKEEAPLELFAAFRRKRESGLNAKLADIRSSQIDLIKEPTVAGSPSKDRYFGSFASRRHSVHIVDPTSIVSTGSSTPGSSVKEVIQLSPPPIRQAVSSQALQGSAPSPPSRRTYHGLYPSSSSHMLAGSTSVSKQGPQIPYQSPPPPPSGQGHHGSPSSSPKQSLEGSPLSSPKQTPSPGNSSSPLKQYFQGLPPKPVSDDLPSLPVKQNAAPLASSLKPSLSQPPSQQLIRHGSASSLVKQEGVTTTSPPRPGRQQTASLLSSNIGDSRNTTGVTVAGRPVSAQQSGTFQGSRTPERQRSDSNEGLSHNRVGIPTGSVGSSPENKVPGWKVPNRALERPLPPSTDVSTPHKDFKSISDPSKIIISSSSNSDGDEKSTVSITTRIKPVVPLGAGRGKSVSESEKPPGTTSTTSNIWKSGLPDSGSVPKSTLRNPTAEVRADLRKTSVGNGGPRVDMVIIDDSSRKSSFSQPTPPPPQQQQQRQHQAQPTENSATAASSRAHFQSNVNSSSRVSLPNLAPKGIATPDTVTLKGSGDQRIPPSIEIVDKDNPERGINTPHWMKMAQQRRDQRRSQSVVLKGQAEPVPDVETVPKPTLGRSSRVLDMVSNIQKQQVV